MRKLLLTLAGALALSSFAVAAEATKTLNVKLSYTGEGTVDEKHKIYVFLFDSPDFASGSVAPIVTGSAAAKKMDVKFEQVQASPVYVVVVFDPKGEYEAMSAPPSGSSISVYSKSGGAPEPVKLEDGKPVDIDLAFDDSNKMP